MNDSGTTNKNDTVHFKQWVTAVTKTDALLLDMKKTNAKERSS